MTFEQVSELLQAHPFRFAKTMPLIPHYYTLRKEWKDPMQFEAVVQAIRDLGYEGKFGNAKYKYLDVDGWHYWTMGAPVGATILINRAEGIRGEY